MPEHLLHVGYAKAGSTFIRAWFAAHPRIAYREGGIAGFQDIRQIPTQFSAGTPTPDLYATSCEEMLAPPHSGASIVKGTRTAREATRTHLDLVCRTAADLFPGARILIVTRGFRGILASSYSQYVRMGGTSSPEKLLALKPGDSSAFDYSFAIQLYEQHFGKDRVIVLPFEILAEDPHRFLAILASELGVAEIAIPNRPLNPSLSAAELRMLRRFSSALAAVLQPRRGGRRARIYSFLAARMGHSRVSRAVARLLDKGGPDPRDALAELLPILRGQAEDLRGRPLYQPYLAEYLLDSQSTTLHPIEPSATGLVSANSA